MAAPLSEEAADWLRGEDPSIDWQLERDLDGSAATEWERTRSQVATEGWGADLLARQDDDGTWGGGLYTPKWTSTNYTLLLLRRLGLDRRNHRAIAGCRRLLDDAAWVEGGVSYWRSHRYAERCVNGMVLSVCSYFAVDDLRIDSIAELLASTAVAGGGWNCEDHRGGTHASFHTTISVLEGLALWRLRSGLRDADGVIDAAHEMLLEHRLYRSHRTGEVIDREWLSPHFPPRWHYDILRGLDHFRAYGHRRDPRLSDAIGALVDRQRPDGTWPKGRRYGGIEFFPIEGERARGRWNTMRALRVLRWWNGA